MSGSDSFLDLDSTLVGEDQRLEPLEEDSVDTVCSICRSVWYDPLVSRPQPDLILDPCIRNPGPRL